MPTKKYSLLNSHTAAITFIVFVFLTIWWMILSPFSPTSENENIRNIWGGVYQIMAYFGGISGLLIARKWGGVKSVLGKTILAFSVGLLCQGFGQSVYTYYLFNSNIAAPYPSLGDLGYFATIPFYIYGSFLLAKASGVRVSLKSYSSRIQAILIPLAMLLLGYFLFLQNYTFDASAPLKTLLDFGYPLGQAIYVSIAILIFTLSRKLIGGVMRTPTLLLMVALIMQFASDYTFLFKFNAGTWHVAGLNDFMYLCSYFLMTVSLIKIGRTFDHIKES